MLAKSTLNPILTAIPELLWANKKVYNAAAVLDDAGYHLLFRAIGDDYISRIGHATSTDGLHFSVQPRPAFEPSEPWEVRGCEDPRVTRIGDRFIMTYTAYDGLTARLALATTTDFETWTARTLMFPGWREGRWVDPTQDAWSKGAAIFPDRIAGRYWLFFGDDQIWMATSDDLVGWTPTLKPVLAPREGYFDASYIEMGPPPILTDRGWLIIYHGIDTRDASRVYRLGAALVSRDDPSHVLWRCSEPFLEPTEVYERVGAIDIIEGGMEQLRSTTQVDLTTLSEQGKLPQAVFCCGAIEQGGIISIYYSGSDTVLCVAHGSVNEILAS
jgi:predicted GH43/DUF377 family glycosyl hydrolase